MIEIFGNTRVPKNKRFLGKNDTKCLNELNKYRMKCDFVVKILERKKKENISENFPKFKCINILTS